LEIRTSIPSRENTEAMFGHRHLYVCNLLNILLKPVEAAPVMMNASSRLKGYSTSDDIIDASITDSSYHYNVDLC
jgi:hypothetical protein